MATFLLSHCRSVAATGVVLTYSTATKNVYNPSRAIPPVASLRKCFCSVSTGERKESKYFPRRAVMYVPANDQRKVKKARQLGVDTVVFDIEDGVALNQKIDITQVKAVKTGALTDPHVAITK